VEKSQRLYAHTKEGSDPAEWHDLETHLLSVANAASNFASALNSANWVYNAGILHDLGKAIPIFQAYLYHENGLKHPDRTIPQNARINHSSTGAAKAVEYFGNQLGRVLAYLIAGHHAGLPDYESCDTGQAALQCRLQEGHAQLEGVQEYADKIIPKLKTIERPPAFVNAHNCHLWIRMLFSCLVDADFLDTEAFMKPHENKLRSSFQTLKELKEQFDSHMQKMISAAPKSEINTLRETIYRECLKKAVEQPGLFSLTVPTGGGKTLSSMAFALEHAIQHNKGRIIYVIPYTSIIEQTANVLGEIFGRQNVIEHHSNLDPENETRQSKLAAENWDAPIIITTNVQFFESLYAAKPGRCRKLHNIINSVVILDEAQLLPPELLKPCVDVINHLTSSFGVTMLLATATQPALPGLNPANEIIQDTTNLYAVLKRTNLHFPQNAEERNSWEDIAERLKQHKQVLCVVNTRKDCRNLFGLMPVGTIHLSALMCGQHRSEIITEIKQRLKNGDEVRVISTQLVEAGVDIDFPVVYRALAGLDSIVQAAGRCNREGKLNTEGKRGDVHVFIPPESAPRGILRKGEDTTRELMALPDFSPDSPEEYRRYFLLFYSRVNDTGSDYYEWLVRDANPDLQFHFRTAAENFKMIDDQAYQPVFVGYGEGKELIVKLENYKPNRDILRKLQRYTVNIPRGVAFGMLNDGLIREVAPGLFVQSVSSMYDPVMGFDIRRNNPEPQDLMV